MTSSTSSTNENLPASLQHEIVQKLLWSGLMALVSAIAAIAARRAAEQIWTRVIGSEPPVS
jgi:hypothetical protein